MAENKERMNEILLELERFRQEHEHETSGNPDWYIRVCQAIVAKAAGYENRNDWSLPMFEQIQAERKAAGTWEMKEGARIYYMGDCANNPGYGVIAKVKEPNEYAPLRYDILMDDGRKFPAVYSSSFKPGSGRRFWMADEYRAYRQEQIAKARAEAQKMKKGA